MPAPGSQHTWQPMALWSAGILLALGLVWFVAVPVMAILTIRSEVEESNRPWYDGGAVVRKLGGPAAAMTKLRFYVWLPGCVATQKSSAVYFMASCGEESVPTLVRMMHDRSQPELRHIAISALGYVNSASPAAIEALMRGMADGDPEVRKSAVQALEEAGPASRAAIPAVEELRHDPDESVRQAAASALKWIRGEEPAQQASP